MRAPRVILCGLLAFAPALTRADDECVWQDPGIAPQVSVDGRVASLREYYSPQWAACAVRAGQRNVEVEWRFASEPKGPPILSEKVELSVARRDGPAKLGARLFPSNVCDDRSHRGGNNRRVTTGPPGREQTTELVPVQVRVRAAGALRPLEYASRPVEIPCGACDSSRAGHVAFLVADNERDMVLDAKLDAGWFECVRRGATLSILAFAGETEGDVSKAIRPAVVVAGLENEFVRQGDAYVLRKALPMARLCQQGNARVVAFELWGRGELMSVGGQGREIHKVKCK